MNYCHMVKKLKELGEFGLIDRIKSGIRIPEGMTGIGDDCAVIPQGNGVDLLVSTDMLVEGTHFIMDDIRPYRLGWKSAAVNLSDIAAMGGLPVATFLSFALPEGLDSGWTDEFFQGYNDISNRYHCVLLGGDTTASPDKVCVSVAILGRCMSGKAIMRSGARDGDKICVTGYLGDAGGGLKVILEGTRRNSDAQALIAMHYQPIPRVEEGLKLAVTEGVHSMIDISDGIGSDLRHILRASRKGAEVNVNSLPLSDELLRTCRRNGWDPLELAISGGEDYELLFTADPDAEIDVPHTVIGRITDSGRLDWLGTDRDFSGYRHFENN